MARIDKIAVTCPTCKGKKVLPPEITRFVPKGKDKCTNCNGRGFVFKKKEGA